MSGLWETLCGGGFAQVKAGLRAGRSRGSRGEDRGFGLFARRESVLNGSSELLRIGGDHVFDIHTVRRLIADCREYRSAVECEATQEVVRGLFQKLQEVLSGGGDFVDYVGETEVLCLNLLFLYRARTLGLQIPQLLELYLLEVLLKTDVESVREVGSSELFGRFYGQYGGATRFRGTCDVFFELLNSDKGSAPEIPISVVKQVLAAVISRVLEIPHAVDDDGKSGDFTTNSTLVPILDYANHSNDLKNAYFDVDRRTGNVLLLADVEAIKNSASTEGETDEIEIFISYSPEEEACHFLHTYGFIPTCQKADTQFFNISFDRTYIDTHPVNSLNVCWFYKWFHINPVLQAVQIENEWHIIKIEKFKQLLIPFADRTKDNGSVSWHYDSDISNTLANLKLENSEDANSDLSELVSSYQSAIQSAKANKNIDTVYGLPQYAWNLHSDGHLMLQNPSVSEALDVLNIDRKNVITEFNNYLEQYVSWRLISLKKLSQSIGEKDPFTVLSHQEIKVLASLEKQLKNDNNLFVDDSDKFNCSLPSLLNFSDT